MVIAHRHITRLVGRTNSYLTTPSPFLDAGHFVWEDTAAEYAAQVSTWWAANRADTNP